MAKSAFTHFLKQTCHTSAPLLLALSGGPDSLYLFYCLLAYRQQFAVPFHVAHVDHQWRSESCQEASTLQALAQQYQVPFHLKQLNPQQLTGNLEAACRDERYKFFAEIYQKHECQALLTGHHQDDQAETILKRLLEGSHWSHWQAIPMDTMSQGMHILRPLMPMTKKMIQQELLKESSAAFDDPTNQHLKFLRARLRHVILPWLNEQFGKNVSSNLVWIGQEAAELNNYFKNKLSYLLNDLQLTSWGAYLNLQGKDFGEEVEIKYVIRLFCERQQLFLSREQIAQAASAMKERKSNILFETKRGRLLIDRQRLIHLQVEVELLNLKILLDHLRRLN